MLWLNLLACFACTDTPTSIELAELPELPAKKTPEDYPRGKELPEKYAAIALVGEVRGEIEPCGCPTLPFGGFNRRENYLRELRGFNTTFHLDAGELLLKGFSTISHRNAEPRAELLVELSRKVGVDAWTVGPSDVSALGLERLLDIEDPTILSSTWVDEQGKWLFPPSTIVEKDGFKLGVIGLSAELSTSTENISFLPPEQAIAKALETFETQPDLIVALGNINDEAALKIAKSQPRISAILTTRGASFNKDPGHSPNTPMVIESPERGRYIQTMFLRIATDSSFPLYKSQLEKEWRDWIHLRQNPDPDPEIGRIESLFTEEGRGRNIMFSEVVSLTEVYEGDSSVTVDIEKFKGETLERAAKTAKEKPPIDVQIYASASTCHGCHSQEFARWTYSSHAKAWHSLIEKKGQSNPECIACHSTGFGQVGGLGELTQTEVRKFKAVQCEACHGPMKGHPSDSRIKAKPIDVETCTTCHDPANSPDFKFSKYLHMASCQMD